MKINLRRKLETHIYEYQIEQKWTKSVVCKKSFDFGTVQVFSGSLCALSENLPVT